MNLVIDDAVEVRMATKTDEEKRRPLGTRFHCPVTLHATGGDADSPTGQILLKGDNVSLIQAVQ